MAAGNLHVRTKSHLKKTYYVVPDDKLIEVFAAKSALSNETKLITALHNLFRGTHNYIAYYYEKGTVDCLPTTRHVIDGVSDQNQFIIATVAAVFTEYSFKTEYLYERATNVCEICKVTAPLFSEFERYMKAICWFKEEVEINFKEQMSWIVAINKYGNIKREIQEHELMTGKEYRSRFCTTTNWALALLTEARAVYFNYDIKFLWIGLNIIPKIKAAYKHDVFIFADEVARIDGIATSMKDRPYLGLVSEIPKDLHMFTHARIIYIGMLHHNRFNRDPTKHVNTADIWGYILNENRLGKYYKKQCEIIVKGLKKETP